jgi:5-methylcytosine-specific restriction endonuclease McrA
MKCDAEKPLDGFYAGMNTCKECRREYCRRYYQRNKEQRKEYGRLYYLENRERDNATSKAWRDANPERHRENNRRWREENKERHRAAAQKWANENREAYLERLRKWRQANAEYIAAQRQEPERLLKHRERQQRRRSLVGTESPELSAAVGELLQQPCAYCGTQAEHMTIDHIVPLARGGKHELSNLAPACMTCNCSKGARLLEEWRPGAA